MTLEQLFTKHEAELKAFDQGLMSENLYQDFYNYYLDSGQMPYGVAKARTDDPWNWVGAQVEQLTIKTTLH